MVLAGAFITKKQNRSTVGSDASGWIGSLFGAATSIATPVNEHKALTVSAYYNAVDQISNDLAKTPFKVYRNTQDGVESQGAHPVATLLSKEPSPLMTSFVFRKMMVQSAIHKGDGFAHIIRNTAGTPVELCYIDFYDVHNIKKYENQLYYFVKGYNLPIPGSEMFHIMGYSDNGLRGIGVVQYAAQSLGISINAQEFASKSYTNKAISSGVLSTESQIKGDVKKLISKGFNDHMNSSNEHRTAVLDDGLKYQRISLTPAELQFLETTQNGVIEVARFLNIAPHKLKDMSNANYSSLEYLGIEHQQDCVMPWQLKWEQEADRKLFTPREKNDYFTRFTNNAILRADIRGRADYYMKAIMAGYMTQNEVRNLENLARVDGHDNLLTPVNAQTLAQIDAKTNQENAN
ncbi:phage portal protein [Nonlabens sp.]|uniref:phage portal protein n=1 Tax=Nonlabens sp. TaxID=1888209 RepID=UPI0039E22AD7